jgi:hypothetical protein
VNLDALRDLEGVVVGGQQEQGEVLDRCRSGEDAQRSRDCRRVATVNSIQAY